MRSLLFAFPLLAIRAFYVGTTRTGILTRNALLMVGCNVVFNYLLIFGKAGLPQLGIADAAIASMLAELVALIFLGIHMAQRVDRKLYGLRFRMDFRLMSLSVWTMVRSFFCIAPWFLFFVAIEHLGETQLAAANIVRSISMLFFIIVNSFATTGISLVSNLVGSHEKEQILPVCRKVIRLGFS